MAQDVLINNVLSYIQSARDSSTKADLLNTVEKFYKLDEIVKSKEIIFDAIKKRPTQRRNPGRCASEIQDILEAFDTADATSVKLPTYAAYGKDALPPSNGYEFIMDAVNALAEEVTTLKSELVAVKADNNKADSSNIASLFKELERKLTKDLQSTVDQLRRDVSSIRLFPPSGAGTTPTLSAPALNELPSVSYSNMVKTKQTQKTSQLKKSHANANSLPEVPGNTAAAADHSAGNFVSTGSRQNKRKKNTTIMGNVEIDESDGFVGVERKADLFIGCGKAVSCEIIKNYCKNKLKINFFNCDSIETRDKTNNYFKLELTLEERNRLLDAKFWPKNTIIRKFYKRRNRPQQIFESSDVGNSSQNVLNNNVS